MPVSFRFYSQQLENALSTGSKLARARRSSSAARQTALLVGIKTAAGIARRCGCADRNAGAGGPEVCAGSHLANMFKAFFRNNFAHEVWGLPLWRSPWLEQPRPAITVATTPPVEAGTIHCISRVSILV